jgi:hypothetical protein
MPKTASRTAAISLSIAAGIFFGPGIGSWAGLESADAADLAWEVVNPFRLYRHDKSFALQESAFKAVRGTEDVPADVIQRVERCLNDPNPADPSAASCNSIGRGFVRRLGWASATLDDTCFDRAAHPRHYAANCLREGASTAENFVVPVSHAVSVSLTAERKAEVANQSCGWRWKPRAAGDWSQPANQPCANAFVIRQVPYRQDRATSGVEVEATLPDGRAVSETVAVDDLFIVALGDSFASGEGNPDKPVTFGNRGLDYRNQFMSAAPMPEPTPAPGAVAKPGADVPAANALPSPSTVTPDDGTSQAMRSSNFDSYVLPRRLMKDEEQGRLYDLASKEFLDAFWERSAAWLSPECHRSQYAFPHRVALQLALEDRHRSITFVNLGCSGAEVVRGLFQKMEAREHHDASPNRSVDVVPQFDQLTSLVCRSNARRAAGYDFKEFSPGSIQAADTHVVMRWCPPEERKRDIDLVLLSVGGNDVGFGALAAYTFLVNTRQIAFLAGVQDRALRHGANVADVYLSSLDARLDKVRKALDDGFKVDPARVIHASYEPVTYDEGGRLCGRDPNRTRIGMDVHSEFEYDAGRVAEVSSFLDRLLERLQCISRPGASCHGRQPAGGGTGFTLVVEHQPAFLRRGLCARDPGTNEALMEVPRIRTGQTDFSPYAPRTFRPYAHHQRLLRTPNDAYLTANEHKGGNTPLFDLVQPAVAALYSGAFHPNAEAHALVADHVMPHARRILARRDAVSAEKP